MNMPDEAVEAAARASFQFMKEEPWEAASPDETDLFRDAARKALAAAAPALLATAWDEGAEAGAILQHEIEQAKVAGEPTPSPIFNPYRSQS